MRVKMGKGFLRGHAVRMNGGDRAGKRALP